MFIVQSKLFFKIFTPRWVVGIALFPFILIRNQLNEVLLNHEKIHIRQQIELLVVGFYIWYVIEFLIRLIQYKHWHVAYRNISFEREAYHNEKNLAYLRHRKIWTFIHYLNKQFIKK